MHAQSNDNLLISEKFDLLDTFNLTDEETEKVFNDLNLENQFTIDINDDFDMFSDDYTGETINF